MPDTGNNILNSYFVDFDLYQPLITDQKSLDINPIPDFSGTVLLTRMHSEDKEKHQEYLELLSKICVAVGLKLNKDSVHLNIIDGQEIQFIVLKKRWDLKRLIVFGPTPSELGIHIRIKPYQVVKWGGTEFLFVDSLEKIHDNIEKKKALWSQLKQLYTS